MVQNMDLRQPLVHGVVMLDVHLGLVAFRLAACRVERTMRGTFHHHSLSFGSPKFGSKVYQHTLVGYVLGEHA